MKKAVLYLTALIALAILLIGVQAAQAQTAFFYLPEQVYLVKDIYPGGTQSFPSGFEALNGKVFFTADNPAYGVEIWFSNGTQAGTQLLKDINPGAPGGVQYAFRGFTELNKILYFTANDGVHGPEMWQTDGTEAGTQRIPGILPAGNKWGTNFDAALGYLFFRAEDATGVQLWRTDGTLAGTFKITSQAINDSYCPYTRGVVFQGVYYFAASYGDDLCGLWKTNGALGQLEQVETNDNNLKFKQPQNLTLLGNDLFFSAVEYNQNLGAELWILEGITGKARMVKDIYPGSNQSSDPQMPTVFQDKLYFAATSPSGNMLWRTDGTETGTEMLSAAIGQAEYYSPGGLTPYGNWLIFKAVHPETGPELYKSDGNQVFLVKDIVQVNNCGWDCGSWPMDFTLIDGQVLFTANSISGYPADRELWRTDGTGAGTVRIADICPGSCSSDPFYLYPSGNHVFFSADGLVAGGNRELWAYQSPVQNVYLPLVMKIP